MGALNLLLALETDRPTVKDHGPPAARAECLRFTYAAASARLLSGLTTFTRETLLKHLSRCGKPGWRCARPGDAARAVLHDWELHACRLIDSPAALSTPARVAPPGDR